VTTPAVTVDPPAGTPANGSASSTLATPGLAGISGIGAPGTVVGWAGTVDPPGVGPLAGIPASGDAISGPTAGLDGVALVSAQISFAADPAPGPGLSQTQGFPEFCPQLVFAPLVSGCHSVLDPMARGGLADTGMPILAGLLGLLLVGTGTLVYRRSRRVT
jgi:hypothetical protein